MRATTKRTRNRKILAFEIFVTKEDAGRYVNQCQSRRRKGDSIRTFDRSVKAGGWEEFFYVVIWDRALAILFAFLLVFAAACSSRQGQPPVVEDPIGCDDLPFCEIFVVDLDTGQCWRGELVTNYESEKTHDQRDLHPESPRALGTSQDEQQRPPDRVEQAPRDAGCRALRADRRQPD